MESGESGNCSIGDYMTHPAFLSIPSTGFWVGKFETGYDGATSTSEAEINERDASKIIVKPNVYSWRGIQLANAFYTSYDYKRSLDSHLIKNTEWGAVAYLQHSAYGSATSVRINNNSAFLTGYQANNEPTCGYTNANEECNRYCEDNTCNQAYPKSTLASTTGNISGIFDMSGGANDYVMSAMVDEEGNLISGRNSELNSDFNGIFGESGSLSTGYDWPDEKYYDLYNYSLSSTQYSYRILGDVTGEMGPFGYVTYLSRQLNSWYSQVIFFPFLWESFIMRGGAYSFGFEAGVFSTENDNGKYSAVISFRLVLTPINT